MPFDKKLACLTNYQERQRFPWPLVIIKSHVMIKFPWPLVIYIEDDN